MTRFVKNLAAAFVLGAVFASTLGVGCAQSANTKASAPVTVTDSGGTYTLANGIVTAKIAKGSGSLVSLVYQGLETLDPRGGGYWSHSAASPATVDVVTINPSANGGARAEVAVQGHAGRQAVGSGPGGSVVADIEIRYALDRGSSGLYWHGFSFAGGCLPPVQVME